MRYFLLIFGLSFAHFCAAQQFNSTGTINLEDRISTIDFVQIIDNNNEEALYYYNNNWKALRALAMKRDYILSYQLLETPSTDDSPFNFILITTYADQKQYDKREDNFSKLINERGELKLLNAKKPAAFRKVIFSKDPVKHLN